MCSDIRVNVFYLCVNDIYQRLIVDIIHDIFIADGEADVYKRQADSTFISEADVAGLDAKQVYLFPATKCAEDNFGTAVCANIVMMGFIVAKSSEITLENAQEALREVMSPKVLELNLNALSLGYNRGMCPEA